LTYDLQLNKSLRTEEKARYFSKFLLLIPTTKKDKIQQNTVCDAVFPHDRFNLLRYIKCALKWQPLNRYRL